MTSTLDAITDPSAPEQHGSMLVMLLAHGWEECEPPVVLAMPVGEISMRAFRTGSYTAYLADIGMGSALLLIYRLGRTGRILKIFRFNSLDELSELEVCLLNILKVVAP